MVNFEIENFKSLRFTIQSLQKLDKLFYWIIQIWNNMYV